MLNILEKMCWGRTIGAYYSGDRLSITDMGVTIKGLTVLNQQSYEIADKDTAKSLTGIFQEYIKKYGGKNTPVCLGLKPEQMFFITSGAGYEQQENLRDKLLDNAGFHNAEERNNVVADYFAITKLKSPVGLLWSISACKKQLATEIYSAIDQAGFQNTLLKPTPWSMSNLPPKLPKKNRGWKSLIHVFLNETGGLAVLVVEKNPICWKRFSFSQPESVEKIESAVRSLLLQSTITLARPMVDGIILEGSDAKNISQKLYDELGIEIVIMEGPGLEDAKCSYSLAMSARSKEISQLNLFRELKPKPGIMTIFPWHLAVIGVFLACFLAFTMWQKVSNLSTVYKNLKKQNMTHAWAISKKTKVIAGERKELLDETEAIEKFLKTRIIWSDYLRDLPTWLPPNVGLSNVWATCEYQESGEKALGGKKKINRSLSLRGVTLFDKGRAAPQEIEAFLNSLRKVELLQRDFSSVQLAEIRWRKQGDCDTAAFTVLASPSKKEKGKGGTDEKGGPKG